MRPTIRKINTLDTFMAGVLTPSEHESENELSQITPAELKAAVVESKTCTGCGIDRGVRLRVDHSDSIFMHEGDPVWRSLCAGCAVGSWLDS